MVKGNTGLTGWQEFISSKAAPCWEVARGCFLMIWSQNKPTYSAASMQHTAPPRHQCFYMMVWLTVGILSHLPQDLPHVYASSLHVAQRQRQRCPKMTSRPFCFTSFLGLGDISALYRYGEGRLCNILLWISSYIRVLFF